MLTRSPYIRTFVYEYVRLCTSSRPTCIRVCVRIHPRTRYVHAFVLEYVLRSRMLTSTRYVHAHSCKNMRYALSMKWYKVRKYSYGVLETDDLPLSVIIEDIYAEKNMKRKYVVSWNIPVWKGFSSGNLVDPRNINNNKVDWNACSHPLKCNLKLT